MVCGRNMNEPRGKRGAVPVSRNNHARQKGCAGEPQR
jgi:hypothetical protein